jgi:hypothetical protein
MGTRADFYLGRGPDAVWLGSVAYDGHTCNFYDLSKCGTEQEFVAAINKRLDNRDDATRPDQRWPWPWEDSCITDEWYAFENGQVYVKKWVQNGPRCPNCGHTQRRWVLLSEEERADSDPDFQPQDQGLAVFPDMRNIQNVTYRKRSGALFLEVRSRE